MAPPLSSSFCPAARLQSGAFRQDSGALLPGSSPAGPPGATFFATSVVLPDATSRIDSESHVHAAPMPRVLAVEQVDTVEAPRSCCMSHRNFLGWKSEAGGGFWDLGPRKGLGSQDCKTFVKERALEGDRPARWKPGSAVWCAACWQEKDVQARPQRPRPSSPAPIG